MCLQPASNTEMAWLRRPAPTGLVRGVALLALVAWGGFAPNAIFAEFYGKKGYTVVFAFSESTSRYGWGFNRDVNAAAQTALQNCGGGAKVVCYKNDGYLCLVWDGSKFAFGHDDDSAQNAVGHAEESFANIHGGKPSSYQCRSSDGDFIPVR